MGDIMSTLPHLPPRMQRLPIDARGYPVPWFVAWLDADGRVVPNGRGKPDFRVISPGRIQDALIFRRCWICGDKLGSMASFVSGPMCGINRTAGEPPSHLECATFAVKACPFLANPEMRRREKGLPEGYQDAAGVMIRRNPGVCLIWTTRKWTVFRVENGILFKMGDPEHLTFWCEGRSATRAEIDGSIHSGLPLLMTEAQKDGQESIAMLEDAKRHFEWLLPPASVAS
jgi:hypothetical protein